MRPLHPNANLRTHDASSMLCAATLLAAALLVVGGAGSRTALDRMNRGSGEPLHLERPLSSLPAKLGDWTGDDVALPDTILRIANNDDSLCRRYRNARTGDSALLFIGYTERPRTLRRHRPTVCYPMAGWSHLGTESTHLQVAGASVPALVHRFMKPGIQEDNQIVVHYYVADGQVSTDEEAICGISWPAWSTERSATRYVAQVEVICGVQGDTAMAQRVARQFAEVSQPLITALMPDVRSPGQTAPVKPAAPALRGDDGRNL